LIKKHKSGRGQQFPKQLYFGVHMVDTLTRYARTWLEKVGRAQIESLTCDFPSYSRPFYSSPTIYKRLDPAPVQVLNLAAQQPQPQAMNVTAEEVQQLREEVAGLRARVQRM
jgi:hypothetical protein